MPQLSAVFYAGGKSGNKPAGRFVAAHIPYDRVYVEPFAGMLGVLLQRRPSHIEIANDLDGNITNWWQVVRDKPRELAEWMRFTPNSRRAFYDFKKLLPYETDAVSRAGMTSYLLSCSFMGVGDTYGTPLRLHSGQPWKGLQERLMRLADRMRYVALENMDALEMLERLVDERDAVIYCDPPYPGTSLPGLGNRALEPVDYEAMCQLLSRSKARVAVSGLADSAYELPGFERLEVSMMDSLSHGSSRPSRRRECLWTNYPTVNTLFN